MGSSNWNDLNEASEHLA